MNNKLTLYKRVGNRYEQVSPYEIAVITPANGFVLANGSNFHVIQHAGQFSDPLVLCYAHLFLDKICHTFPKDLYDKAQIAKYAKCVWNHLVNREQFKVEILKSCDHQDPFTVYTKINKKYEVHGLKGGFGGFKSDGIYLVDVKDGLTYEDCIYKICSLSHLWETYKPNNNSKNYSFDKVDEFCNGNYCGSPISFIMDVFKLKVESDIPFSICGFTEDILFLLTQIVESNYDLTKPN